MIEMLVRLNPIASEIKLEICKKVAEGWFKGIIVSVNGINRIIRTILTIERYP